MGFILKDKTRYDNTLGRTWTDVYIKKEKNCHKSMTVLIKVF